ncbi:tetraspanin-4 isoform X2 [Bos javanicus]|uniref:tetraspanin-4 isoform X2 n=1 Tax=Bos javanicus TaxID=9906 RepID=UPI002AA915E1|nr:tetraspanin-4 isoform X2 [Bos javanicus]
MRRSSTDESTYRRSPSPPGKEPGFARGGPFFGLHASPGPKAAQARYTSPKGNKYVVFYLDLSFIFLLELKRCSMARGCLQGVKYLMFAFNLLFWGPFPPYSEAVIFLPKCFKSCLHRSSFTITAGRLWHPGRGHLAGGHAGELRHPVLLLPVAVGRQPAHRHRRLRDGHRLRGLHRGHQGEQMPPAHLLRGPAAGVPARGLHHHPLLRLH